MVVKFKKKRKKKYTDYTVKLLFIRLICTLGFMGEPLICYFFFVGDVDGWIKFVSNKRKVGMVLKGSLKSLFKLLTAVR